MNTVTPQHPGLPEKCFASLEATGEIIVIHRGAKGYTPTGQFPENRQDGVNALNEQIGVTRAQAAAMLAGSMFGWACPGADPTRYDEQGRPVKPQPKREEDSDMKYTKRGLQIPLEKLRRILEYAENRVQYDCMEPYVYVTPGDRPRIIQYCYYAECNPIDHTSLAR